MTQRQEKRAATLLAAISARRPRICYIFKKYGAMVSYRVGCKSYNYHALEQKYGIYLQIYFISYSEIGKGV